MGKEETALSVKKQSEAFAVDLGRVEGKLISLLSNHMRPERYLRTVTQAMAHNPKLFLCDRISVLSCFLKCAQLTLEPDGLLGHAHLVPFGKEAVLILGFRGLQKLAMRTGVIQHIAPTAVYKGDDFKMVRGTKPSIVHVPDPKCGRHNEDLIAAYSVASFNKKGMPAQFECLYLAEIEKIRDNAPDYKRNSEKPWCIWVKHFDQMSCKSATRRLCKVLEASVDDNRFTMGIELDERGEMGIDQMLVEEFAEDLAPVDNSGSVSLEDLEKAQEPPPRDELSKSAMETLQNRAVVLCYKQGSPTIGPDDWADLLERVGYIEKSDVPSSDIENMTRDQLEELIKIRGGENE